MLTRKTLVMILILALGATVFVIPAATAAAPLKIHMISGSKEYESAKSLTGLKQYIEQNYNIACTLTLAEDKGDSLPGINALDNADLLIVFCRRVKPPAAQLAPVKAWCQAGKPVIGIRTASHAFQDWPEFDKVVLGGDYEKHSDEDQVQVLLDEAAKDHPILAGVQPWSKKEKLYHNPSIAKDTTLLLRGVSPKEQQPLAWCRTYNKKNDGRCFYTSMRLPEDFENEDFRRLLVNAIAWTTKRELERK